VIIATGLNHPDALASASLAAAIDAPILLVAGGTVPGATLAEVNRLAPTQIFILGGTAAVPQSAENVLDDVAPVTRLAGANRYGTAIEISRATHSGPVDTVYVAPGTSFVEALVAGPVAASRNAGILLVPPTSVPGSVANELQRLDPASIVVVGGGGVISSSVVSQLGAYADSVTSISGANRYDTSVRVAQHGFPGGADTVLIATGAIFPDALAGAGVGGDLASPILLVESSNLPGVVASELGRLDPLTVRVLGGPAAVSDSVVAEMVALLD
jgi:putative cell wall-binding protein